MGNKPTRAAVTPGEKALQTMLTRPTTLHSSHFELARIGHHGVPSNAKTMAFCGLQGILALGTASGAVKLYGNDGLEVLIDAPRSKTNLTIGIMHMKFTAQQRLVVTYTNSSIRIYNLANVSTPEVEVPETWTLNTITCLETIQYMNFPYIFVALDDGNIHVLHEETGKTSTYIISPRDCGVATTEDDKHLQAVTAMAVNPRDANQLLIAYDVSTTIYQWDLAKHKLAKDFTLAKGATAAHKSSQDHHQEESEPNSVQSISWHSSGKRFVAGFKFGGFAIYRHEKPHGLYHRPNGSSSPSSPCSPITRIQWLCAPPTSRHSYLPGAVIFSGGRASSESHLLTVVYPPREMNDDDALTSFVKSEPLTWKMSTIQARDGFEIDAFCIAMDQVDYSARLAPFSVILLSGNPLDGHQPAVSVQSLPCFVRLREDDKEDWEWIIERTPRATALPPALLQTSALKTCTIVNLTGCDGTLQGDLVAAMDRSLIDPVYQLMLAEDFDWPINGGSIVEPLVKGFVPPTQTSGSHSVFQTATLVLTGHADGKVLFWETHAPSDRSSRGTIKLLHVVDVTQQIISHRPVEEGEEEETAGVGAETPGAGAVVPEISCLSFCHESRTLMVGFSTGEIAVLVFGKRSQVQTQASVVATGDQVKVQVQDQVQDQDQDQVQDDAAVGFHVTLSLHIHSSEIQRMVLSTAYQYAAVADASGVVSLIELTSKSYELVVFDISSADDPVSVESLLLSELVQVTEIPVSSSVTASGSAASASSSPPGKLTGSGAPRSPQLRLSPFERRGPGTAEQQVVPNVIHHREIVPILFVGRGNGKLEMFHVQTATKIGESLFDSQKMSALTSILMVDAHGRNVSIKGRSWQQQQQPTLGGGDATTEAATLDGVTLEETKPLQKATGALQVTEQVFQFAEHVLALAIAKATDGEIKNMDHETDFVAVGETENGPNGPREGWWKWPQHQIIETRVPSGSLGLHLYTEVDQHAVVKGFVLENDKALALAAQGVRPGHSIVSINGVDLLAYSRSIVCFVLEQLRDQEKVMVFAQGFGPLPDAAANTTNSSSRDPEVGSVEDALAEKPKFLVCTCGKSLFLVQATLPKASEIAALGAAQQLSSSSTHGALLASLQVSACIIQTQIIRVPVHDKIENCLVVVDQSHRLYVVSLMTLTMLWSVDLPLASLASGNNSHFQMAINGELMVFTSFGEMERFCLFAEPIQRENAIFERHAVKTRVFLDERSLKHAEFCPSPKKKGMGIAALKKLVSGATKEVVDLNKVFHFSVEDDERQKLLGGTTGRKSVVASPGKGDEKDKEKEKVKKATDGLGATKDALNQATQHLHERGEKLSDLAVKTEQMKDTAEDFYKTMKAFNEKNSNKKWYEF